MQILIDADGCPVVRIAAKVAKEHSLPCTVVCDSAHMFDIDGAEVVTVDKGADSADFALVNLCRRGDIVVTQDYGLAAMCLAKGGRAINQNGMIYSDSNIEQLLDSRYLSKKARRAGQRLKGPRKRTDEDDNAFLRSLLKMLQEGVDKV